MAEQAWEKKYNELMAYYVVHGDVNVRAADVKHSCLYRWVQEQRRLRAESKLSDYAVKQLDMLNIDWEMDSLTKKHKVVEIEYSNKADAWDEKFELLCAYQAKYGNCRVPRSYKPDKSLGLWVGNQRMLYKKGILRRDRKEKLDRIGFESVDPRYVWSDVRNTSQLDSAWMGMYKLLREYRDENGHTHVPKNYVHKKKYTLGRWVSRQKTNYLRGTLREDRKAKLDELDFHWTPAKPSADDLEPIDFRSNVDLCSEILPFKGAPPCMDESDDDNEEDATDDFQTPPIFQASTLDGTEATSTETAKPSIPSSKIATKEAIEFPFTFDVHDPDASILHESQPLLPEHQRLYPCPTALAEPGPQGLFYSANGILPLNCHQLPMSLPPLPVNCPTLPLSCHSLPVSCHQLPVNGQQMLGWYSNSALPVTRRLVYGTNSNLGYYLEFTPAAVLSEPAYADMMQRSFFCRSY